MKNIIKTLDHYLQITKYRMWLLSPSLICIIIGMCGYLSLIFKFKIPQPIVTLHLFTTMYVLVVATILLIFDLRKINKR